jgi:predicted Fe-Mo cluster-binding NifX family protein
VNKLLIPIQGDFVAPRFDLATEILIVRYEDGTLLGQPKTIIMERPSDEELCQMIVEEHITAMVCNGIEELHYNFLIWKKVNVLDGVIGDWQTALDKILDGTLQQGAVLYPNKGETSSYET